jgi:hypothetical protein
MLSSFPPTDLSFLTFSKPQTRSLHTRRRQKLSRGNAQLLPIEFYFTLFVLLATKFDLTARPSDLQLTVERVCLSLHQQHVDKHFFFTSSLAWLCPLALNNLFFPSFFA